MKLLTEFFTTDVGIMSAVVIAITLGMAVYYVRFFINHMHEDEARQRRGG